MGAVQWDKKCHNTERPSVRLTVRLGNKWHSYYSRGCGGKIETSAIDFYVMYVQSASCFDRNINQNFKNKQLTYREEHTPSLSLNTELT